MSDNRRVIRVRDLVIKADNVYIEPQKRRDPFFGGPVRGRQDDDRLESSSSSSVRFESSDRESRDDDRNDDRRPFSWI